MKKIALLALTLGAIAVSTSTLAQSVSAPLTRAQVRADLIRLERAGYNPAASNDVTYPDDIQAAEAKVAAQDAAGGDPQVAATSMGGTPEHGASEAGKPMASGPARSIYSGH
ncbi:DUF4148 domain-containing protein [Burkholderia sp. PU8-34]